MGENIILIGFMGSGKTSSAKKLAVHLGWEAVEMDELILKRSGKADINEIFEESGELGFRLLEMEVAKDLCNSNKKVISTGGGIIMNQINMMYLKECGRVFYLKDNFDLIMQRLSKDKTRPLLKDRKKAQALFDLRCPLYEHYADDIIDGEDVEPKIIAEQIYKIVK